MNNWIEAVKKPLEMMTGRHEDEKSEELGADLVKSEQHQPKRAESSSVARRAVKGPKAVSYTHLTLPTIAAECRSRWSPYH